MSYAQPWWVRCTLHNSISLWAQSWEKTTNVSANSIQLCLCKGMRASGVFFHLPNSSHWREKGICLSHWRVTRHRMAWFSKSFMQAGLASMQGQFFELQFWELLLMKFWFCNDNLALGPLVPLPRSVGRCEKKLRSPSSPPKQVLFLCPGIFFQRWSYLSS